MENQRARVETSAKFTWNIKNFSKLNCQKLYSETFFTGCHPWRILLYPKGSKVGFLSIYLDAGDTANLPAGWSRSASFKLSLINQFNVKMNKTRRRSQNLFNASSGTFGYESFISSAEFQNPTKGFLVDDTCIIVAEVSVENSRHEDTNDNHSPTGELMEFKGIGKIEKDFVQLLEEVCSKHPTLIESQRKRSRSQSFTEWSFTALGRVLHFLKTKKVKDMNDDTCKELQNLWDELRTFGFDLTWLSPHVYAALGMKNYKERAMKVKKLKEDVTNAERHLRTAALELKEARSELAKADSGFVTRDLDDKLGYGIPKGDVLGFCFH